MGKGIYQKLLGLLTFKTIVPQISAFLLSIKALYCALQDESVGMVDYKKHRAPGQHRSL